ncbi:MAG: hypothetical protein NUV32_06130 [Exilispira sp.]|jgi:hypothetical protein|nr:hypothetical protein [Exilispira sp.]
MKILSISTSIFLFILLVFQPLILKNQNFTEIISFIEDKSLICTTLFSLFFLTYLFFFFYTAKNKEIFFPFFTLLSAIFSLVLAIFSLKLSFFNLLVSPSIINLIFMLLIISNSILIFISSIFQKQKNYFLVISYRIILFINILFSFLHYIGNQEYKILYQYVTLFSIVIWKIMISFTFEIKKSEKF